MKLKYLLLIFPVALLFATGCKKNFLDAAKGEDLNNTSTFADSAYTMQFLNTAYERLDFMLKPTVANTSSTVPQVTMASSTDEAEIKWTGDRETQNLCALSSYLGNYKSFTQNGWSTFYYRIRMANIFIRDVDKSPLSPALKARTKAEARMLRAFYYSFLVRLYGGVPLLGDAVKEQDSPYDILRSSYANCIDYIVAECDAVSTELPVSYSGLDYGRVTKGAALALKARMLLTAASPLINGGSTATDPAQIALTGYPSADPNKWEKAFQAAEAVINLGQYQIYKGSNSKPGIGFYELFLKRVNPEYILTYLMAPSNTMEYYGLPFSRTRLISDVSNCLESPTQELVDAFPMKNGKLITDPASGYNPQKPYLNRDPRFYYSIVYNGAKYLDPTTNTQTVVNTSLNANPDGVVNNWNANSGHTKTGYFSRKMCDSTITGMKGTTDRGLPVIRYAEIILDHAEAANETGRTQIAINSLKLIRERAGIDPGTDGNYGISTGISKNDLRELIRNERYVELAYENNRYFDIRRWKICQDPRFNAPMHGIVWSDGSGTSYTKRALGPRKFTTANYFLPIPDRDLQNNPQMINNPGW